MFSFWRISRAYQTLVDSEVIMGAREMETKPIRTLKMFGLLAGFVCDGQVDGGYYADPEDECQAFHIFTSDGAGGLAKYSFL